MTAPTTTTRPTTATDHAVHAATADTTAIHPLLAGRWSTRAFDATPVDDADLRALLEAARWAPSAMNHQPWRFLVGRADADGADPTYTAIFDALAPGNQQWAGRAPVLVAALAATENPDGSAREIGPYELGLAVAQLTVQAHALGLHVHQMGGFDAAALRDTFEVPSAYRPVVVLAVGRRGDVESLPGWALEREDAARERLPLEAIAYADAFGRPLAL